MPSATNSFGASRIKLEVLRTRRSAARELNGAAAASPPPSGRPAASSPEDIGPTGKFLKPQGEYTEDEFEESFAVQARALAEGGVDFLLIETMFDLREALCAVAGRPARRRPPGLRHHDLQPDARAASSP